MTLDQVIEVGNNALYLIITTSAPVLLVSLVIGLLVSIFQTVTSIQEQTMTFVPKILCVFLTLMLLGYWMMQGIVDYMTILWSNFSVYLV